MKTSLYLIVASVVLVSCSSQRVPDGPSVSGRKEFDELKHRDPALGVVPTDMRQRELAFAQRLADQVLESKSSEEVQAYASWKSGGPWNIGGRTRAIAFDIRDAKTIIIGAVSGGIWKSTDAGATWQICTKPDQLHSVACVAQDTRKGFENIWYAGTGEIYGNSAQISGNGILKSTDNGNTWSPLPSTVSSSIPANHQFAYTWRALVHSQRDSQEVYVATARAGLYRSTNGGAAWTAVLGSNSIFSDVVVTSNGTLYAAFAGFTGTQGSISSRWGVFRSTNGTTWTNVTPPDMKNTVKRIVLAPVPQHPEQIFVLAETPDQGAKGSTIYRGEERFEWHSLWKYTRTSADTGTWENRSANIPLTDEQRGDFYSQGGYDLLVKVSPHDSNLVVIGGTNLYRSTDGLMSTKNTKWIGGYWKPTPSFDKYSSYKDHHPDQHDVLFHPANPKQMFSANDGGVYVTDDILADSVVWRDLNRGYLTTQFYTVDIPNMPGFETSRKIIGGMQDNSVWFQRDEDEPTTTPWLRVGGGDGAYSYFVSGGPSYSVYYSSQQGRVYYVRYDSSGKESYRKRIDPIGPKDYLFINPYVPHPVDQHMIYMAGDNQLWRLNDVNMIPAGNSDSTLIGWDSLTKTNVGTAQISCVLATTTADGKHHRVFYGTSSGKVYRLDSAERGNPTPKDVTSTSMRSGAFINSVSIDPRNREHVVVCLSNYGVVSIFETFDAGDTWQAIAGNLEENLSGVGNGPAVNWAAIRPYDDSITVLIAATSTGLYFTPRTNGMSTVWTPTATEELGNVPCDMVVTRMSMSPKADKTIAVATHGRGTWWGEITSLPARPSRVELASPPDMRRGILPDTVLTWKAAAGAVSYSVFLECAGDTTRNASYQGIRETSFKVQNLKQGPERYTWTVEPYGAGGAGERAQQWSFSTAIRPPALLKPAAAATDVSPVVLVWERVPGARRYDVEVAANAGFKPIVASASALADTSYAVPGLESAKRYFWRVRSIDDDATGVFSDRQSFVTGTITGVADVDSDAGAVSPNPAHNRLTIAQPTGTDGQYVIELVAIDGRSIRRVDSSGGSTTIDVSDIASGQYIVRVTANGVTKSSSVVIRH
ncbi:MAG: T9SS type A sorting domain-containing protein [Candidatus Kapabacteria bacterium]|nr:T9SS type A sorting domain-containing protein [Candidatus Kapabacteria bacterium]